MPPTEDQISVFFFLFCVVFFSRLNCVASIFFSSKKELGGLELHVCVCARACVSVCMQREIYSSALCAEQEVKQFCAWRTNFIKSFVCIYARSSRLQCSNLTVYFIKWSPGCFPYLFANNIICWIQSGNTWKHGHYSGIS